MKTEIVVARVVRRAAPYVIGEVEQVGTTDDFHSEKEAGGILQPARAQSRENADEAHTAHHSHIEAKAAGESAFLPSCHGHDRVWAGRQRHCKSEDEERKRGGLRGWTG